MSLSEWTADTLQYDLSDEYSLRLADDQEWGYFAPFIMIWVTLDFSEKKSSTPQGAVRTGSIRMRAK